jgi:hypothetical protein
MEPIEVLLIASFSVTNNVIVEFVILNIQCLKCIYLKKVGDMKCKNKTV